MGFFFKEGISKEVVVKAEVMRVIHPGCCTYKGPAVVLCCVIRATEKKTGWHQHKASVNHRPISYGLQARARGGEWSLSAEGIVTLGFEQ
jgi:hypothetical protein